MTERIEKLARKFEELSPTDPFLDGPGDFLVKSIAFELRKVPQFALLFGEFIDPYKRLDYPDFELPCLRVYNNSYGKTSESGWIEGAIQVDVIMPASIRRDELQIIQDRLSSALLQQFRRPAFFDTIEKAVPGLNQLGRTFDVDKELGFQWGDDVVPMTQITLNFRLDLRKWDDYLEASDRTKDDPFERTLGELTRLTGLIQGLNEAADPQISLGVDQNLED